ncbi:MAG: biopolymer transporter ExbD [Spirochaetota bacterium]|nr:MAG: biopolymer transporter ExbD [Spirochaetota bacterium]
MIEFEEFNDSISKDTGPDLTPLIDMVFLLLIFFLLTSFFIRPSISVNLPEAEHTEVTEQQDITITIEKDGDILLNGKTVSERRLVSTVRWLYSSLDNNQVVIQSDREVPFGRVVQIMDLTKKAGVENISFLVERSQ